MRSTKGSSHSLQNLHGRFYAKNAIGFGHELCTKNFTSLNLKQNLCMSVVLNLDLNVNAILDLNLECVLKAGSEVKIFEVHNFGVQIVQNVSEEDTA